MPITRRSAGPPISATTGRVCLYFPRRVIKFLAGSFDVATTRRATQLLDRGFPTLSLIRPALPMDLRGGYRPNGTRVCSIITKIARYISADWVPQNQYEDSAGRSAHVGETSHAPIDCKNDYVFISRAAMGGSLVLGSRGRGEIYRKNRRVIIWTDTLERYG